MRRKTRIIKIFLLVILFAVQIINTLNFPAFDADSTAVYANSAQVHWEGIYATGALAADENCPLMVEKEVLTFDIQDFPKSYYSTAEDFAKYSAKVTAKYTFYNPADYTVKAVLRFPFGGKPQYAYDGKEYDGRFKITVDGNAIEKKLRHSFFYNYEQFDLNRDMALLENDFSERSPYHSDTPVYKYVYEAKGIDPSYTASSAAIDVPKQDGAKPSLLIVEQNGIGQLGNTTRRQVWVKNGTTITVYAFASPISEPLPWKIYKDGGCRDGDEIDGTTALKKSETTTFMDFVMTAYDASSGVSEIDWYNAFIHAYFVMDNTNSEFRFDIGNLLMRWYEYELVVAPKQRADNAVEAPLYPSINGRFEPHVYTYDYLLSPAKTWASFGSLDIIVNTPYSMMEINLGEFKKADSVGDVAEDEAVEAVGDVAGDESVEAVEDDAVEAVEDADNDSSEADSAGEGYEVGEVANAGEGEKAEESNAVTPKSSSYILSLQGLPDSELKFSLCSVPNPTSLSASNVKVVVIILLVLAVIFIAFTVLVIVILRLIFRACRSKKRAVEDVDDGD